MLKRHVLLKTSDGAERKIGLPVYRLEQSTFYSDMMKCYCNGEILPFPSEYNKSLPHYIDYCYHGDSIKVKVHKLRLCFELANFLGDDKFLKVLIGRASLAWPACIPMLNSLPYNIQYNISQQLTGYVVGKEYNNNKILFFNIPDTRSKGQKLGLVRRTPQTKIKPSYQTGGDFLYFVNLVAHKLLEDK